MDSNINNKKENGYALLPMMLFIALFLGTGVVLSNMGVAKPFGQLPGSIAAYAGVLLCFILFKGSMKEKLSTFINGIAKPNVATLCIILTLAGGFSGITKAIGGVDSIVGVCMTYLPKNLITGGIFIIGSMISFASGTSVGTITALGPIAISVAAAANIPIPIMVGAVLSSAMFGNGTSLISDATIAATTQLRITDGQDQKDKLIAHLIYSIPSFLLTTIIFILIGSPQGQVVIEEYAYSLPLLIPYIIVLVTALIGINVVLCLSGGIVAAAVLGLLYGNFSLLEICKTVSSGMDGMANLLVMTFFISGMVAMVSKEGGLEWIISKLRKMIRGKTSAEFVCLIVSIIGCCCVGKDAVSLFAVGNIINDISKEYDLDPRKIAIIAEAGATTTAVFIPYSSVTITMWGLVAGAGFENGFVEAYPYTLFPIFLVLTLIISIFIPSLNFYLNKKPMNLDKHIGTEKLNG